jgi:hypothetical protein
MLASHQAIALLSGRAAGCGEASPRGEITLQQIDAKGLAVLRRNDGL